MTSRRPYWQMTGTSLRTRIAYWVRTGTCTRFASSGSSNHGTRKDLTRSASTRTLMPRVGALSLQYRSSSMLAGCWLTLKIINDSWASIGPLSVGGRSPSGKYQVRAPAPCVRSRCIRQVVCIKQLPLYCDYGEVQRYQVLFYTIRETDSLRRSLILPQVREGRAYKVHVLLYCPSRAH